MSNKMNQLGCKGQSYLSADKAQHDLRKFHVGLAPMEGVLDFPMRLWFHLIGGFDNITTPFLRVTQNFSGVKQLDKFLPERSLQKNLSYQIIPQVMASNPCHLVEVTPILLEAFSAIELNAGCPSPKCVGKGAGSSLLQDSVFFSDFLHKLSKIIEPRRLRIKIRTGFASDISFSDILRAIDRIEVQQLTIHGRTSKQRYSGMARWDLIRLAGEELKCPVVGSGDILSWNSYQTSQINSPRPVIIGRGALRNPWVFHEIQENGSVMLPYRLIGESLGVLLRLHGLWRQCPDGLRHLVRENFFRESIGKNLAAWQEINQHLRHASLAAGFDILSSSELKPGALSRLKLLWNYFRSSLPKPFFDPKILRVKTFPAFMAHLDLCHQQLDYPEVIKVEHQQSLDWIYTSNKKDPRTAENSEIKDGLISSL